MVAIQGKCIKCCLIILNLLFSLLGLMILLLAFWFRFDQRTRSLFEVAEQADSLNLGIYAMWAAGAMLLVSGFTGYFGATRDSKCLLWVYLALLIVLALVEMGVAIWAFVQKDKVIQQLKDAYTGTIDVNSKDDVNFQCLINTLHKTLDCCGYTDTSGRAKGCTNGNQHKDCLKAIEEIINSKLHIFAAIAFSIALVTAFGIILTILLQRIIKSSNIV
uniref:CD9 antigen-like n=1 Tax=Pristiophorus japonicus TaxID=55135 RepID=UPI00398F0595